MGQTSSLEYKYGMRLRRRPAADVVRLVQPVDPTGAGSLAGKRPTPGGDRQEDVDTVHGSADSLAA